MIIINVIFNNKRIKKVERIETLIIKIRQIGICKRVNGHLLPKWNREKIDLIRKTKLKIFRRGRIFKIMEK